MIRDAEFLAISAAGVFLAWLAYQAITKGPQAVAAAAQAVNPLNSNNVFAQSANAVTSTIAGRDTTLGGYLWEWMNPGSVAKETGLTAGAAPAASGLSSYWTQYQDANYLNSAARAEKITAMNNLRQPVTNDAGIAWLVG